MRKKTEETNCIIRKLLQVYKIIEKKGIKHNRNKNRTFQRNTKNVTKSAEMPINKGKMRKKQQKNGFKTRVKVINLID